MYDYVVFCMSSVPRIRKQSYTFNHHHEYETSCRFKNKSLKNEINVTIGHQLTVISCSDVSCVQGHPEL